MLAVSAHLLSSDPASCANKLNAIGVIADASVFSDHNSRRVALVGVGLGWGWVWG